MARTTAISASLERCSAHIRDVRNLTDYEQKVRRSETVQATEDGCIYQARGFVFGWPWKATFDLHHTDDGGFHSTIIRGPMPGMSGGFTLRALGDGRTEMRHHEDHPWPWWSPGVWMLGAPLTAWMGRTLEIELEVIKRSIEWSEGQQAQDSVLSEAQQRVLRSQRYTLRSWVAERLFGQAPRIQVVPETSV